MHPQLTHGSFISRNFAPIVISSVVSAGLTLTHIGADFRFDVPGQSSVGLIGGGRGQWLGGTMASAEHEPIMGVWGQKPPEAESILVMNVQRSRQI